MTQPRPRRRRSTEAQDLVARKLRTGEIVVWDPEGRSIILIAALRRGEGTVVARVISGASFRALEEVLGDVVALI